MKDFLHLVLYFNTLIFLAFPTKAQSDRYAATVTPSLNPPYSMYLEDYANPAMESFQAQILFSDYNESYWTFKLFIEIYSLDADIRLTTKQLYQPSPIIVSPGELYSVDAATWSDYLNPQNLDISGSGARVFYQKGRLPEGNYQYCIQILDYETGKVLSPANCTSAWLQLMNPPDLLTPSPAQYVNPEFSTVNFSWQLFNATSLNDLLGTQYDLTIWELQDNDVNPMTAVQNDLAIQVFREENITLTSFVYDASQLELERGKIYLWQVRAIDPGRRDIFKNQGKSQFNYFYYGWPTGGIIDLLQPTENSTLPLHKIPMFSWDIPNNLLMDQPAYYEIEVKEKNNDQDPETAFSQNTHYYFNQLPETYNRNPQIDTITSIKPMQPYVWKVTAYTDELKIAESHLGNFMGPVLMDYFYAGSHKILVDHLESPNLLDISGKGRVRLSNDKDLWTEIDFANLVLEKSGNSYMLRDGIITIEKNSSIALSPVDSSNSSAKFDVSSYLLDKSGLKVKGRFNLRFPHPVLASKIPVITSREEILHFDNFRLFDGINIGFGIDEIMLAEPGSFLLSLDTSSLVYINENRYRMELDGLITVPAPILENISDTVHFVFSDAKNLEIINTKLDQKSIYPLRLVRNCNLYLHPLSYTIDLSSARSNSKNSSDWTGIKIHESVLSIQRELAADQPVVLDQDAEITLANSETFLDGRGLTTHIKLDLSNRLPASFYTFSGALTGLQIHTKNNRYHEDSHLAGTVKIPLFNARDSYDISGYITQSGLEKLQLIDLKDRQFEYNAEKQDQHLTLEIESARFYGIDRISCVISTVWHVLDQRIEPLRGFNIWGDGSIGFGRKNGTVSLVHQLNTQFKGYPATVTHIAAGSDAGNYSLALKTDVLMGQDVSGDKGAPSVNIYSLIENAQAPAFEGSQKQQQLPETNLEDLVAQERESFERLGQKFSNTIQNNQVAFVNEASYYQHQIAEDTDDDPLSEALQSDQKQDQPAETDLKTGRFSEKQKEIIDEIIQAFVNELVIQLMRPIENKLDTLNYNIHSKIDRAVDKGDSTINQLVSNLILSITKPLISTLENDKIPVGMLVNDIGTEVKNSINNQVSSALHKAIQNNIQTPIYDLIEIRIITRIRNHISYHASRALAARLNKEDDLSTVHFDSLYTGLPRILEQNIGDILSLVSPKNLNKTVKNTISDLIMELDLSEISSEIASRSLQAVKNSLNSYANKAVADLLEKHADNILLKNASDLPIDFAGMGSRLARGELALDPIHIKMKTRLVELDGYVQMQKDHPVYGDVFTGDIDLYVKAPTKFAMNTIYLNGRKDDLSYWFVQISPPRQGNSPAVIGNPISKEARPLPNPAKMGIMNLEGASGRIYHHMSEDDIGTIVPDPQMKYGAFLNLIFFDAKEEGKKIRLEVAGEVNVQENGDFRLAFDGNLNLESSRASVTEPDPRAPVYGSVSIKYNSAEKHFFGYAQVIVNKPNELCAEGSLLVDVKPSKWRVAIGSRQERLTFVPACMGWSPTGWLDLNQDVAELGLGLQWSIQGRYPSEKASLPAGPYLVNFDVSAGVAFGIVAAVQYKPLALQKAGVWADLWALVSMNYKLLTANRWKNVKLVDLLLQGNLIVYFVPKPTYLEGTVSGYVQVLFFKKEIYADMYTEI